MRVKHDEKYLNQLYEEYIASIAKVDEVIEILKVELSGTINQLNVYKTSLKEKYDTSCNTVLNSEDTPKPNSELCKKLAGHKSGKKTYYNKNDEEWEECVYCGCELNKRSFYNMQ